MAIPGKEIFRTHDRYGPVQVFDDGNKRYLALGSDDQQSCQLKTAPAQLQYDYTRAMLLPLLFKPQPKNCLLLGLGGGSLANCLYQLLDTAHITAVELRSGVIEVAYSHFSLPDSPRLSIIESDARDYLRELETCNTTNHQPINFDMIFSDIYGSEGLDDLQLQEHYIDQCQQLLTPDGWLILNCWKEHRGDAALLSLLKERFNSISMCTTQSDNWVIIASQSTHQLSLKELRGRAKKLAEALGFSLHGVLSKLRKVL